MINSYKACEQELDPILFDKDVFILKIQKTMGNWKYK